MATHKSLSFNKRPLSLVTFAQAVLWRNHVPWSEGALPTIEAEWNNIKIDKKHYEAYFEISEVEYTEGVPILYPLMLVYPVNLRIFTHPKVPLSLFRFVGVRNRVVQHREIAIDEVLDINCRLSGGREVLKGMEFDISSIVTSGGEILWENTNTYFMRGDFAGEHSPPRLEPITDIADSYDWFLSSGKGFRFARISGDSNGMHYSAFYAKLMGYKRDFAQPMLVLTNSLSRLPKLPTGKPVCLETHLKGPIYYKRTVTTKSKTYKTGHRFDLYSEGNDRPCISGKIYIHNTDVKSNAY
ncbi:MAG: hypothetical protein GY847_19140 [Proteobacteria bacterium]|nr:hypothetical protein [Pseudomonadota bacterium]